ncbi:hypothetical protein AMECASPLE_004214, partial [Ameca splendens]
SSQDVKIVSQRSCDLYSRIFLTCFPVFSLERLNPSTSYRRGQVQTYTCDVHIHFC